MKVEKSGLESKYILGWADRSYELIEYVNRLDVCPQRKTDVNVTHVKE